MDKSHQIPSMNALSLLGEPLATRHEPKKSQCYRRELHLIPQQSGLHAALTPRPQSGCAPLHDGHKSAADKAPAHAQQC
ncbi:Uncharacterised protein [Vibrio cholerae]|nr:Uncharacterised protein [Vibrio cholerae]